jgi:hypothetical protein
MQYFGGLIYRLWDRGSWYDLGKHYDEELYANWPLPPGLSTSTVADAAECEMVRITGLFRTEVDRKLRQEIGNDYPLWEAARGAEKF